MFRLKLKLAKSLALHKISHVLHTIWNFQIITNDSHVAWHVSRRGQSSLSDFSVEKTFSVFPFLLNRNRGLAFFLFIFQDIILKGEEFYDSVRAQEQEKGSSNGLLGLEKKIRIHWFMQNQLWKMMAISVGQYLIYTLADLNTWEANLKNLNCIE